MKISKMQFDAILAGLRLLEVALEERTVRPYDGNIGDILTDGQTHEGLTSAQVSELADQINSGDENYFQIDDDIPAAAQNANPSSEGQGSGTYQVGIDRIGYRSTLIPDIVATSARDAAEKALAMAGDIEFAGEHDADYSVSSVTLVS